MLYKPCFGATPQLFFEIILLLMKYNISLYVRKFAQEKVKVQLMKIKSLLFFQSY
jgi:hypothetical protein